MALLQQHDARRDILIEPAACAAACSDRSSGAFRTWGIRNWGRNRAVKTNRLVGLSVTVVRPVITAEPTEMLFSLRTQVDPRNHVLDGFQISSWEWV